MSSPKNAIEDYDIANRAIIRFIGKELQNAPHGMTRSALTQVAEEVDKLVDKAVDAYRNITKNYPDLKIPRAILEQHRRTLSLVESLDRIPIVGGRRKNTRKTKKRKTLKKRR